MATDDVEALLARFEAEERIRLGLAAGVEHWTDAMTSPRFSARERPHTTLLIGGLTLAHDFLAEAALRGLGYECRRLDCPDNAALRVGREFGNVGQCNPTYFTVGNLVKELCRLRDEEGLSAEAIVRRYVFVSAGACGPCRFGMYVTEYRKALRDAGFEGFRVLLFQQTGGLRQASGAELGMRLDPTFFCTVARALFAGDVINALGYRLRPYELEAGATDRALEAIKREVYAALCERRSVLLALRRGRKHLRSVKVDLTQAKPKVSILGEFWAMTTEGDGNYGLQRFIEQEGGESSIQLLVYWLLYVLWTVRHDTEQRLKLKGEDGGRYGLRDTNVALRMAGLWAGELALRGSFRAFAHAAGLRRFALPDMDAIARASHGHYNRELRGGEGHMEVGKLILDVVQAKAHMTLSVKPFGCMPSSGVSDGVQSAVTELYPQALFCTVETSGEGAVNFYSRVQLVMFRAKQRAQAELAAALDQHGITRQQAQAFLARSHYGRALYRAPHRVCGSGADLIHQVGPLIDRSPLSRAALHAKRGALGVRALVVHDLPAAAHNLRQLAPHLPGVARWLATKGLGALPTVSARLQANLQRWLEPTAQEQAEIARAAAGHARMGLVQLRQRAAPERTSHWS